MFDWQETLEGAEPQKQAVCPKPQMKSSDNQPQYYDQQHFTLPAAGCKVMADQRQIDVSGT